MSFNRSLQHFLSRPQSSFSEVAKLFTEFFRDLDVVPTDVIAGLVLLRRHQKVRRKFIVEQVCVRVCVRVRVCVCVTVCECVLVCV